MLRIAPRDEACQWRPLRGPSCVKPPRPALAHRAIVRFVSDADAAKTAKTKGFISPNETKHFVWLVISY
jgi:hypothetical protein